MTDIAETEEITETEEAVAIKEPIFVTDAMLNDLFTAESILEREVPLHECGCIAKEVIGMRVIQTQAKGKILKEPIHLGVFTSSFAATDLLEANRGEGKYAIRDAIMACGHTRMQWDAVFGDTGGNRDTDK